jgi:hypothetical protein
MGNGITKGHKVSLQSIGIPLANNYAFEPKHGHVDGGSIRTKCSFGNEN